MIKNFYKIALVGDSGVGKSSFIHTYIDGKFPENLLETIGVELFTAHLQTDDQFVIFRVWDLGGHERFFGIHQIYVEGVVMGFVFYDLTNPLSIKNVNKWVTLLRTVNPFVPILLIGTKLDLISEPSANEIRNNPFFTQFNAEDHFLLSSKTGKNIRIVFETASRFLMNKKYNPIVSMDRVKLFDM